MAATYHLRSAPAAVSGVATGAMGHGVAEVAVSAARVGLLGGKCLCSCRLGSREHRSRRCTTRPTNRPTAQLHSQPSKDAGQESLGRHGWVAAREGTEAQSGAVETAALVGWRAEGREEEREEAMAHRVGGLVGWAGKMVVLATVVEALAARGVTAARCRTSRLRMSGRLPPYTLFAMGRRPRNCAKCQSLLLGGRAR